LLCFTLFRFQQATCHYELSGAVLRRKNTSVSSQLYVEMYLLIASS